MVICTFQMLFDPGLAIEATHLLQSLQGPVRSEPGCRGAFLYCEPGNMERIAWISRWENWDGFEKHVRNPRFRKLLGVLEMAALQPEILIERSHEELGIDAIAGILLPADGNEDSM